jgi:hypothetical protein
MAERYGGKHSPDGSVQRDHGPAPMTPATAKARKSGLSGRMFLYALTPLPFLIRGFSSEPRGLILGLSAAGLLALAVWLTQEGLRAQAAYDERRVSRRPAFPRKIAGSVLTGCALLLGGMLAAQPVVNSVGFLVLGALLHLAAFGPDPMKDKGMEGIDQFQSDRVARAVNEAEGYLAGMKDAVLRANDRSIEARVEKFAVAARAMFRTVEEDPGDLTAARKYLSVFMMGARDATVKFADLYGRTRDPKVKDDFDALLTDLETHFASRTEALLSNNRTDLDVEIGVLRERLEREV